MTEFHSLWETHRNADWPKFSSPHEGQLMTLDTVISGCVVYFLEHSEGLDLQRLEMLDSCLADLKGLVPDLPEESRDYFERLQQLAGLLRDAHPTQ